LPTENPKRRSVVLVRLRVFLWAC